MRDQPVLVDLVCIYCGHAWCIELPASEKDDSEYVKCPNCDKEGGKRVS